MAQLEVKFARTIAKACSDQQWSENLRLCIADADEYERARIDCTDEPIATADELAALPPELDCKVLAQHVYTLAWGPHGKLAEAKQKIIGDLDRVAVIDRMSVSYREHVIDECDQRPWATEYRRCIAAATEYAAISACGRHPAVPP